MLALAGISLPSLASSNDNIGNVQVPYINGTNNTNNQEIIFKTPDSLKNESSKLEYKSTVALPSDNSWNLVNQQEPTSQFTPKVIKKDDSNFLSVLSTNQFPANTVRVVIDKIETVDVDSRFYRIPNIKTESINDYVYVTKNNTTLNYKPSAQEIADYNSTKSNTIYLTNIDGKYTASKPEDKVYQVATIQEKVGESDWAFGKQLAINLSSNSISNQQEADNIVRKSNFDNQDYTIKAPSGEVTTNSTPAASTGSTSANPSASTAMSLPSLPSISGSENNIIPWIATIAGFGILNLGIRQYFKKQ
jgi:hypothetical protein